jgi:pentapeptide repeat protein
MKQDSPFIRFRQGISRDLQRIAYRLNIAGPRVLQWLSDPRGLKTGLLLIGAGLLYILILVIIYAPPLLVASWRGQVELKDLAQLESNARVAVVQALGGTALLIGLFFTWRSIRATERNLQITQQTAASNLVVAMDGHLTERFTRAIEHLGSDQLAVQLGAIYTLEQIAWPPAGDAPAFLRNRWPIMEILNAYVRAHASWPPTTSELTTGVLPKPRPEIQAILTVLGRRSKPYGSPHAYLGIGGQPPNLRSTDLRGADLSEARFEEALLREAHLEHANLWTAHLEKAELIQAHLGGPISHRLTYRRHTFGERI